MKLTIIPSDGFVAENGKGYSNLTWSGTPTNVHALQWDDSTPITQTRQVTTEIKSQDTEGNPVIEYEHYTVTDTFSGWIEFNNGAVNEFINEFPEWVAAAQDAWAVANTPKPVSEPEDGA